MVAGTIKGFMDSTGSANMGAASLREKCESIYRLTKGVLNAFLSRELSGGQCSAALRPPKGIMHFTRLQPGHE